MSQHRCGNCDAIKLAPVQGTKELVWQCRRGPPTIIVMTNPTGASIGSYWPPVSPDDHDNWCSKWAPAPGAHDG